MSTPRRGLPTGNFAKGSRNFNFNLDNNSENESRRGSTPQRGLPTGNFAKGYRNLSIYLNPDNNLNKSNSERSNTPQRGLTTYNINPSNGKNNAGERTSNGNNNKNVKNKRKTLTVNNEQNNIKKNNIKKETPILLHRVNAIRAERPNGNKNNNRSKVITHLPNGRKLPNPLVRS